MRVRLIAVVCIATAAALGQQAGSLIVSAEPKDHQSPLQRDDISAEVDHQPARVSSWTPLTGDQAALQLYIVIDDADSTQLGVQFGDLKNFINSQPATTQIGIAYLRFGTAQIAQAPTADHARAAKALRIPLGEVGVDASPYVALSDLVSKWPPAEGRREVLAIMSGIDPYYQSPDMFDPYLQQAVTAAQKAGILISSIYYSSEGHFGHSFYRTTWGQNYLSLLDENSGGEYYWQGLTNPVALQPFLAEYAAWLTHQYRLTLEVNSSGKPELKPVRVRTSRPGVSLLAPSQVYLGGPAAPGAHSELRR